MSTFEGARALAIGAHPDDVEFGCFGSLSRFSQLMILVLSKGEHGGSAALRVAEAERSAALLGATLSIGDLPDREIPLDGAIGLIEEAVSAFQPDVVFTMSEKDMHQDHLTTARASHIALRHHPCMVLAYATPSNAERFQPQVVLELSQEAFDLKLLAVATHASQSKRNYLNDEFIVGVSRYWAAVSRSGVGLVEAFELVKWIALNHPEQ